MIVQRAGDVIPQVVGPVLPAQARHEAVPDADATARSAAPAIVKPEGEVMHRCPNRACPSRGLETLINWVMAAADIEGVGEQFVRRLWDEGLVRSMPDLYRLTKEQLLELDGFGEISAQNAVEAIAASKADAVLARALRPQHPAGRLGHGAEPRAPLRHASTRCWTASQEEIEEVEGIGPDRAEAIAEWFADEREPGARRGAARARARLRGGRGGAARRGAADGAART